MKTFSQLTNNSKLEHYSYSPWQPSWFPPTDVTLIHQLPILETTRLKEPPEYATSFVRDDDCFKHNRSIIHGYVDDVRLQPMIVNPARYLVKFARHLAVITPDFSIKIGMPRHDRIRSVFMSRSVGAFYQQHGLDVIPNIRWAEIDDLDFALDGLPCDSTIAFSTQGLLSDPLLTDIFESGVSIVLQTLNPSQIVLYGEKTKKLNQLCEETQLTVFPTDLSRIHGRLRR
jgi:hypothetical protein